MLSVASFIKMNYKADSSKINYLVFIPINYEKESDDTFTITNQNL